MSIQHLPLDILFLIFTEYLDLGNFKLLTVCKDWYELTNYEMFWILNLKKIIDKEIIKEKDNINYILNNCYKYNQYFNFNNLFEQKYLQKESKDLIKKYKQLKEIIIIKLKPFTKKKESGEDIYGNVFKNKTREFMIKIYKRRFIINFIKTCFELQKDLIYKNQENFTEKVYNLWIDKIIPLMEENKQLSLKEIGQLNIINNFTIFSIFLKQLLWTNKKSYDWEFYYLEIVNYLVDKCEVKIMPCLSKILELGLPFIFYNINDLNVNYHNYYINTNNYSLEEIIMKIEPTNLFKKIETEIKKFKKIQNFLDVILNLFYYQDFGSIYLFSELFKQIKTFKYIDTLKQQMNTVLFCARNLDFNVIKYLLFNLELKNCKDYNNELLIEEFLTGTRYSHKYDFKNIEEKQEIIINFLKELNIDYNDPAFITSIFYYRVKFTKDFILFILNNINDDTLNLTYKNRPSVFLQLLSELKGFSTTTFDLPVIELLLDRGALINNETNNINNFNLSLQDIDTLCVVNIQRAKDYIRIVKKLMKAGGKISKETKGIQMCFFKEVCDGFPLDELKEVINFFIVELEIKIDVESYYFVRLFETYNLEEQKELRQFLLENYNIFV